MLRFFAPVCLLLVLAACATTTTHRPPTTTTTSLPWHDTQLTVTGAVCPSSTTVALPVTVTCPSRHFPPWQEGMLPIASSGLATSWASGWRQCVERSEPALASCDLDVVHDGPAGPALRTTSAGVTHFHARRARAVADVDATAAARGLDASLPWMQHCFTTHIPADADVRRRVMLELDVSGVEVRGVRWMTPMQNKAFRSCVSDGVLALRVPMASSSTWTWTFIAASHRRRPPERSAAVVLSSLVNRHDVLQQCLSPLDGDVHVEGVHDDMGWTGLHVSQHDDVQAAATLCLRKALGRGAGDGAEAGAQPGYADVQAEVVDGHVALRGVRLRPMRNKLDLQREVRLHRTDLLQCAATLAAGKHKLLASFLVDGDGRPKAVRVDGRRDEREAAACLRRHVERMRFAPLVVEGDVRVEYPFVFDTPARPASDDGPFAKRERATSFFSDGWHDDEEEDGVGFSWGVESPWFLPFTPAK